MFWLIYSTRGQIQTHRCEYSYITSELVLDFPEFQAKRQCKVLEQDLLSRTGIISHEFSGSSAEKEMVLLVHFTDSTVEFIPANILENFPNLKGIVVENSTLEELKEGYLFKELGVLKHLQISNNLKTVQKNALAVMENLESAWFSNNKIEVLPFAIFSHNHRLRFIDFSQNKIKAITPELLKGLTNLQSLDFQQNICVKERTSMPAMKASILFKCYDNCKKNKICADKVEEAATTKPEDYITKTSEKEEDANSDTTTTIKTIPSINTDNTKIEKGSSSSCCQSDHYFRFAVMLIIALGILITLTKIIYAKKQATRVLN